MANQFSLEDYAAALEACAERPTDTVRAQENVPEVVVQQFWYDYGPQAGTLTTLEGHTLEVLSPGWWNFCAGPDFQGAQLRFNGTVYHGDVEVHLDPACWRTHGHHQDPRYNNVILHVILNRGVKEPQIQTQAGRQVPHLVLDTLCATSRDGLQPLRDAEEHPELAPREHGSCNRLFFGPAPDVLNDFIHLSGEWRLLNKARQLEERITAVGANQAAYEMLCRALGYRPFTTQFERIARALPYERAVQLAVQEPFLLESALLHLAGLLPTGSDETEALPAHGQRLSALREEYLSGLRPLNMDWPLAGVRPNNYPARRLAGLAGLIGGVARGGLTETLQRQWHELEKPVALRRAFEALFPRPMGYWARHYHFGGTPLGKPRAVVGAGRARSVIGNVFVPLALAQARLRGNQSWEEQIFAFYRRLPMEPDNGVYQRMVPRVLGDHPMRMTFCSQQGLLQMHEDWCRTNPSCRNCALLAYLESRASRPAT